MGGSVRPGCLPYSGRTIDRERALSLSGIPVDGGECSTLDARSIPRRIMKARVYVSLKKTVLDPQGQTIQSALNGLGHKSIHGVRQGKFFEIDLQDGVSREAG